jgi:hypothetical protein
MRMASYACVLLNLIPGINRGQIYELASATLSLSDYLLLVCPRVLGTLDRERNVPDSMA